MANGKFVAYRRVSTLKQGASGLGLEAQQQTIKQYLSGGNWQLLAEFTEVESGKHNNRPELAKALKHCKLTGATLLVAKLDRLSRDIHFITSLEKAGVDFTVCDFPSANKFTIHIFAALAQYERELISQRTSLALAALKAKGRVLGRPDNLNAVEACRGRVMGRASRSIKASAFACEVSPTIHECLEHGMSLNQTAGFLNDRHILTATGRTGTWTAQAVKNIITRIEGRVK
jgi:DNA invertase Pin-like site-specific DNA recombinase